MFSVTVINFLLFSLGTGTEMAICTMLIQKALILDIEYPLSAKREFINSALQNLNIIQFWSANLTVSSNLLPLDLYEFIPVEGIIQ